MEELSTQLEALGQEQHPLLQQSNLNHVLQAQARATMTQNKMAGSCTQTIPI